MKRFFVFALVAAALLWLPASALADWTENFDSYASGSQLSGQGGWEMWTPPNSGALVSSLYSLSPANSVEVVGATDIVHRYSGYTSGTHTYTAWMYIPTTFSGMTYFIMLNTYDPPNYDWSVQVGFDMTDGMIHADCGSSNQVTMPFVTGQWAEIKVRIYLDDDWTQVFYNGTLLDDPALPDHPTLGGGYQWTGGVFGGGSGALNIGAVDLYANSASEVYYDDMSLMPDRPTVDVNCNGQESGVVVPSGTNAKIDYAVNAGAAAGYPVDIWIVMNTPFGFFSYDGAGPYAGWNLGLGSVFASGPLAATNGTALDQPLPAGSYKAYIGIDLVANGVLNMASIYTMDMVDFTVQ